MQVWVFFFVGDWFTPRGIWSLPSKSSFVIKDVWLHYFSSPSKYPANVRDVWPGNLSKVLQFTSYYIQGSSVRWNCQSHQSSHENKKLAEINLDNCFFAKMEGDLEVVSSSLLWNLECSIYPSTKSKCKKLPQFLMAFGDGLSLRVVAVCFKDGRCWNSSGPFGEES